MCGFKLARPCPKCPFRTDVPPYLHGARAQEIATSLLRGADFPCHQTTVPDPDDESQNIGTTESQFCAGALIMLEREEAPNQAMRFAERLGLYDPAKLDMAAPVVGSALEFVRHHGEDEQEPETCSVCGPGCDAPAGWLEGGVVVPNLDAGETFPCDGCGEPVCGPCGTAIGDKTYCEDCAEYEAEPASVGMASMDRPVRGRMNP